MAFQEYSADELTPEHVTAMLRTNPQWADVIVGSVEATPVGTGQMAHSFRLQLGRLEHADSLPRTVIAKISSTDPSSRQMAAMSAAYQREVYFYQRLANITKTRIPECYFAEIADDMLGFVLLLEDLGPASTLDQLSGCSPDEAELAVVAAAALHGPSWQHARLGEETWLPVVALWTSLAGSIPQVTGMWLERFGGRLKPEHIPVVEQLGAHLPSWMATIRDHRCLWHGDFRLDNMLFDAQGGRTPLAVVDWQSVSSGPGVADVSYFLGNSMLEDVRVKHERDLVEVYHGRLAAYGVEGYSFDRCWQEYRAQALYGLILSIPVSLGVEATERGDRMFAAMSDRAAHQIVVNESYSALESL